ncbi:MULTISPECIES: hypothetical protein [Streptomyces]|uniref:hypothetical protein n=1 Tax=Streptomyces TaxID=1883 RepID=UPI00069111CE|nr:MULTISPECIES: hypothetical protein [Streptomyces]
MNQGEYETRNCFRVLAADWRQLCAEPRNAARVRAWLQGAEVPQLPQECGLEDLLAGLKNSRVDSDVWLRPLLDRGLGGGPDAQLAVRVVVEAMTPSALSAVRRLRAAWSAPVDDVAQIVLSALYSAVAGYPLARRPRKIAANLARETYFGALRELRREQCTSEGLLEQAETLAEPEGGASDPVTAAHLALLEEAARDLLPEPETGQAPGAGAGELVGARAELVELLVWALRSRVLTPERVRVVADHYRPAAPGDVQAAGRLGVRPATLRQWRSRAVRELRRSAPEWLAQAA